MRVALCTKHVVLAEILAHVLARRGESVVVMARDVDELSAHRLLESADVAVVDIDAVRDTPAEAFEALAGRAPLLPIIALVQNDVDIEDDAFALLRPRAVCDKRQRMNDLLDLLDRVAAGGVVSRSRQTRRRPSASALGRTPVIDDLANAISPREREVLCGLVGGADTVQLARSLGISVATTRSHIQSILTKLGAHTRLAAVSTAIELGLVDGRSAQWRPSNAAVLVGQSG